MLVPSKKLFYAAEAVLYIAYHAKNEPISGREVAQAQGLPTRYLEPLMQKLVRAGVLRGVRGPTGGYVLGRERRRITLADIASALRPDQWPEPETPLGSRILRPAIQQLTQAWHAQLQEVTIAHLCERAAEAKINTVQPTTHDFTI